MWLYQIKTRSICQTFNNINWSWSISTIPTGLFRLSMQKTTCMPVRTYEPVIATNKAEMIALKLQTQVPVAITRFQHSKWTITGSFKDKESGRLCNWACEAKRKSYSARKRFHQRHRIDIILQLEYLGCRLWREKGEKGRNQHIWPTIVKF